MLIGERITRFYYGTMYVFKRVGKDQWEYVSEHEIIPQDVIDKLPK